MGNFTRAAVLSAVTFFSNATGNAQPRTTDLDSFEMRTVACSIAAPRFERNGVDTVRREYNGCSWSVTAQFCNDSEGKDCGPLATYQPGDLMRERPANVRGPSYFRFCPPPTTPYILKEGDAVNSGETVYTQPGTYACRVPQAQ